MATQRRPIIAGNWKMFKTTLEAQSFVKGLWDKLQTQVNAQLPEIVLCAPFTALSATKEAIAELKAPFVVAAQTMESRDNGAYTGEISPLMLLDIGVRWVILGHSERRQYFNETDATVAEKMTAALSKDMVPVVCVGENLEEREAGKTDAVIESQMAPIVAALNANQSRRDIVLAYEPVWAIGTGKVCESDEAARVCGLIRKIMQATGLADNTRILYGGSVKADNVEALMSNADIDGALVGGASLEADSFSKLIQNSCLVSV